MRLAKLGMYHGKDNPFYDQRHSEQTKMKISIANSGKNNANYGKHPSREVTEKNRQAHLGVHRSENTRHKISLKHTGKTLSFEHRQKIAFANSGENSWFWKGGVSVDDQSYILIKTPNHPYKDGRGYVRKHRLIYEDSRNCCLLRWVVIHHKDGDKRNNIWYNLVPMTLSDHSRLEIRKRLGLSDA